MARLLIADVTLLKATEITAQVRFNGGATHTLHLPLPKPAWLLRQTSATVVAEIDRLLEEHTDGEIADLLNNRGLLSGDGKPFHRLIVRNIRITYSFDYLSFWYLCGRPHKVQYVALKNMWPPTLLPRRHEAGSRMNAT